MRTRFLFLLVFIFSSVARAQENDAGFWVSAEVEKEVLKNFSLGLTEELRLKNNYGDFAQLLTDFGGVYKPLKFFSIGLYYRYSIIRNEELIYRKRHRMYVAMTARAKKNKLTLSNRLIALSQYSAVKSSETGKTPENYLRDKITIRYDMKKKWEVFGAAELFLPVNHSARGTPDEIRFQAGIEKGIKKSTIEGYFMIKKDINMPDPLTSYIIGIGYKYEL